MFREKMDKLVVPLPETRCPHISIKSPGFKETVPVIETGVMSAVVLMRIKVAVSSNEEAEFPFFTMKKAKKLPVLFPLTDMDALI